MKVCLFDWDGTLLDNSLICQEATKYVFEKLGSVERAPTIAEFVKELEEHDGDYEKVYRAHGINAPKNEINEVYGLTYARLVAEANLARNAFRTLQELRYSGINLGLITMQMEHSVVPLLVKFDIYKFFKYLYFHTIDKTSAIVEIWEQERMRRKDFFYVGDSPSDIRQSNNAGSVSVAYLNGHVPYDLVLSARPKYSIFDFYDLLRFNH